MNEVDINKAKDILHGEDYYEFESAEEEEAFKEQNSFKKDLNEILMKYSFTNPFLALDYKEELNKFGSKNISGYTQGCKWSPDGSCFLVGGGDKKIRVFDLPPNVANGEFNDEAWLMGGWKKDIKSSAVVKESEYIYDYQWYPLMQYEDEKSSCFAVTCRELPIHLWDSHSGKLICSYIHYNHLDLLVAAHSVAFSVDGLKLIGGYSKEIREFHVTRPGRESTEISSKEQVGIISTLAFHPVLHKVLAAGSYAGSVGLYSLDTKQNFALFKGHKNGVTHIQFSHDGTKLFSGTRKDDDIYCWDMRKPGEVLSIFQRKRTNNQKIYFDVTPNDQYLLSGTTDGEVLVWDNDPTSPTTVKCDRGELLPSFTFKAHKDSVNGLSVHPTKPILLTSSGQRVVAQLEDSGSSDSDETLTEPRTSENSVKLWFIG